METDPKRSIRDCLAGTGRGLPSILDRHGRVLMSAWNTLKPGSLYVVGLNPGGPLMDLPPNGETIGASFDQHLAAWNYFSDEASGTQATTVLRVLDRLGISPRETLTTNALFVRSANQNKLPLDAPSVWRHYCRPVHELMASVVQPRLAVCFGLRAWQYMTGLEDPGHWNFDPDIKLRLSGLKKSCSVILLPHFSPTRGSTEAWRKNKEAIESSLAQASNIVR